jgi:hypothetical protein
MCSDLLFDFRTVIIHKHLFRFETLTWHLYTTRNVTNLIFNAVVDVSEARIVRKQNNHSSKGAAIKYVYKIKFRQF